MAEDAGYLHQVQASSRAAPLTSDVRCYLGGKVLMDLVDMVQHTRDNGEIYWILAAI